MSPRSLTPLYLGACLAAFVCPIRTPADASHSARRDSLRIGLIRAFGHPASVTVSSTAEASLVDAAGAPLAEGSGGWTFTCESDRVAARDSSGKEVASAPVLRVVGQRSARLALSLSASGPSKPYRGEIELAAGTGGRMTVVDLVPIEEYLRGVLPLEMPPSAPAEAQKAQAVAARTYALKMRGRFAARGYDLTDSTDCQMYGGVSVERAAADAAIRATAGLVLVHDGALVLADYYDDCGGVTAPGSGADDYPPSVRDAPEDGGSDYCARGSYHSWTLRLAAEELAARLPSAMRKALGRLSEVIVADADASGRAAVVALRGEYGTRSERGADLRAQVGYDRLKSTLFTVRRDGGDAFLFTGRGYGHGHGLCQMGAIGMASAPYNRTFREILDHYFPGSRAIATRTDDGTPPTWPEL